MPRLRSRALRFIFALALIFTVTQTVKMSSAHAEGWTDSIRSLINGVKRKFCPDEVPGKPASTGAPATPWIAPEPPSESFKSEGELRRYIECYLVEPGRYEKVAKEYMPIIQASARSFNIPTTLLACLIFRESRFDINARSSTGAIGLGQHLTGTMKHITDILQTSKERDTEKLLEIVNTPMSERIASKKVTAAMAQKDLNYAKTVLRDREFRLKWEEHFKTTNETKCRTESTKKTEPAKPAATTKNAKPKPAKVATPAKVLSAEEKYEACLSKSIPRVVNTGNIKDPKIAIAASAMYLQMILVDFQRVLDTDIRTENGDGQNPNYDLLLAAAGAYNMGPGAAANILGPIEPPDRKKWVEALMKSNEETAGHVASIRNCIQSSASNHGDAFQAPIGSHNYECNDGNESSSPRTVVGKSELPAQYRNSVKTASLKPAPKAAAKPAEKSSRAAKPAGTGTKTTPKVAPKTPAKKTK